MSKETKFPDEVWCRDGWGCWHFLIQDLCREMNGSKIKNEEEELTFETKLGLLKTATTELEKMLLPSLGQNMPISEMPCRQPNTIVWGRDSYRKGLVRLEQFRREKETREEIAKLLAEKITKATKKILRKRKQKKK